MGKRISRLIGIPKIPRVWESRGTLLFPPPSPPSPSHRIFITVPVTNKLLIPCRVLDFHFWRLWLFLPLSLSLSLSSTDASTAQYLLLLSPIRLQQFSPTDSLSFFPLSLSFRQRQPRRLLASSSSNHSTRQSNQRLERHFLGFSCWLCAPCVVAYSRLRVLLSLSLSLSFSPAVLLVHESRTIVQMWLVSPLTDKRILWGKTRGTLF